MTMGIFETTSILSRTKQDWHWFVEWVGQHGGHLHGVDSILYSGKTPFQTVEIYQTHDFGKLLVLDGVPQSSEFDQDIYHEALVHPALITYGEPETVFVLGGGEGATLREVLRYPSVKKAIMVDIDETLVRLCEKELPRFSEGAFQDLRSTVIFQDVKEYISRTEEKFDCVVSDLTDPTPDTPSEGLLTEEFFRSIKQLIRPGGVFAMQASYAGRGKNKLYRHLIQTLKRIWKVVRPYRVFIPSFYFEWGFVVASDSCDPLKLSREQIEQRLSGFSSHLQFYDSFLHHALFTLPKELR